MYKIITQINQKGFNYCPTKQTHTRSFKHTTHLRTSTNARHNIAKRLLSCHYRKYCSACGVNDMTTKLLKNVTDRNIHLHVQASNSETLSTYKIWTDWQVSASVMHIKFHLEQKCHLHLYIYHIKGHQSLLCQRWLNRGKCAGARQFFCKCNQMQCLYNTTCINCFNS
jgi:hypothetical protein